MQIHFFKTEMTWNQINPSTKSKQNTAHVSGSVEGGFGSWTVHFGLYIKVWFSQEIGECRISALCVL